MTDADPTLNRESDAEIDGKRERRGRNITPAIDSSISFLCNRRGTWPMNVADGDTARFKVFIRAFHEKVQRLK